MNYLEKKIPKKIFISCFKFVFLTKKFNERWPSFLKLFLNAMIMNIKIHNVIGISKSMEHNKWKKLFKCFLWFFKVWWVQGNQGVTFLVVHLRTFLPSTTCTKKCRPHMANFVVSIGISSFQCTHLWVFHDIIFNI